MQGIVEELLSSVALLVLVSFTIGFVFDRSEPSPYRNAAIGLVGGIAAFVVIGYAHKVGGFVVDGRTPILLVTSFFGGPIGALVAAPLPIAMRLEAGGGSAGAGVLGIIIAVSTGAVLRAILDSRGTEIKRSSILILAALSPLPLIAFFATPGPLSLERYLPIVLPLLIWTPLGTLALGALIMNEWTRAWVRHEEAAHSNFLREADHVSREFMEAKLQQDYRLYKRYGAEFGYMVVAIDDAATLHFSLPRKDWDAVRSDIAKIVRRAVRECDVCAPVAFERFGVIVPYANRQMLGEVAGRVQDAVRQAGEGAAVPTTVSIGLAHVEEAHSGSDLEVIAEQALILATAVQPTGAIGPQLVQDSDSETVTRSFPGAVFTPPAEPDAIGDGDDRDSRENVRTLPLSATQQSDTAAA